MDAAVKARCSAFSEISSAIHAIVKDTILPPIEETMYNGARRENRPITGVVASRMNTIMATMLENRMTGHRRPFNGLSEIQTQVSE